MTRSISITAALALFLALAVGTPARAGVYLEVGDAGDINAPQSTVGIGSLNAIFGNIGGADTTDAFGFLHTDAGGFFFIGSTSLAPRWPAASTRR